MESFIDVLLGGGLGSAIGAIAGIGQEFMRSKFTAAEKAAERKHIVLMHRLQNQHELRTAENEFKIAQVQADRDALIGSFQHDSSLQNTSTWVNNIRAMVRPVATAATFLAALWNPGVWFTAFMLCLTWWFSGRTTKYLLETQRT